MQGSHRAAAMHGQEYRALLRQLLAQHLPEAQVYDPLADHTGSLEYDDDQGRAVFFQHNHLCREVDLVLAFVPEASMGTAIEMWEAHRSGRAVIAISPLVHNWAVKFLSRAVYPTLDEFIAALERGEVRRLVGN